MDQAQKKSILAAVDELLNRLQEYRQTIAADVEIRAEAVEMLVALEWPRKHAEKMVWSLPNVEGQTSQEMLRAALKGKP